MRTADLHAKIVDSYLRLLKTLSPASKLDLISKLTQSVKSDIKSQKSSFKKAFGAWDQDDNADELLDTIRDSRLFNRKMEEL